MLLNDTGVEAGRAHRLDTLEHASSGSRSERRTRSVLDDELGTRKSRGMSRRVAVLLTVTITALAGAGAGAATAGAATQCPAAFSVLHNDAVGSVAIPRGKYLLRPTGLACASAASLLGRFLDDFDGLLPGGWATAASGRGFVNVSRGQSFTLQNAPTPASGGRCPGTFTVEHSDRIGSLRLHSGRYAITTRGLSCGSADRQFAFFLFHDFAGTLSPGWRLNAAQQRFTRGRSSFTIRYVSPHGTSGGGGVHPNLAITCPGTVSLAAGTAIGALVLPAGRYYVNVFSNLSCTSATTQFEQFAAAGALPAQWVLEPETGTFLRGRVGFQIEPAS